MGRGCGGAFWGLAGGSFFHNFCGGRGRGVWRMRVLIVVRREGGMGTYA